MTSNLYIRTDGLGTFGSPPAAVVPLSEPRCFMGAIAPTRLRPGNDSDRTGSTRTAATPGSMGEAMITPEYLRVLFDYHSWATGRVLETAARLDPADLDAAPLAGLGSLRQILVHALSAEWVWRAPGGRLAPHDARPSGAG